MTTAAIVAAVVLFLLATLPPNPRVHLSRRCRPGSAAPHRPRAPTTCTPLASDGSGRPCDRRGRRRTRRPAVRRSSPTTAMAPARLPHLSTSSGVLCLDGVEISTNGGHYVALGMPTVAVSARWRRRRCRRGCHGGSAASASRRIRIILGVRLAWSDWSAPIEGIEWINLDSEWRDERSARRWRGVPFDYFASPGGGDRFAARSAGRDDRAMGHAGAIALGHRAGGSGCPRRRAAERMRVAPAGSGSGPATRRASGPCRIRVLLERPLDGTAASDARLVARCDPAGECLLRRRRGRHRRDPEKRGRRTVRSNQPHLLPAGARSFRSNTTAVTGSKC